MKSLKTILLSAAVVAGFGILLGGKDAYADTVYTVQSGDTLSSISYNAFGNASGIEKIAAANGISNKNLIYVGTQLTIPTGDTAVAAAPQASATPAAAPAPVQAAPAVQESAPAPQAAAPAASQASSYSSSASGSDAQAKEWIANKESSGSYTAVNGQYYGRYQLTNSYLNGDYSAANQEKVADQYVASRYGSWSAAQAFWVANGWY